MDKALYTDVVVWLSAILSIVVVIVNGACIYVIMAKKRLRKKPPMIFILNLLCTHLLQGLLVLPSYAVKKWKNYPKYLYPFVCSTWRLSYMLTFYGTCINVLLVAIDRFIATKYSLNSKLSAKKCRISCGLAWLYISVLCLVPFIPIKRSKSLETSTCLYNQPHVWTIFMLMCNTVLPFLIILIIYIYIARKMNSSAQELFEDKFNLDRRLALNRKITMLTIKITLIYGVTWLPSIVYYSIVTIAPRTFPDAFYVSDAETIVTFINKYITFLMQSLHRCSIAIVVKISVALYGPFYVVNKGGRRECKRRSNGDLPLIETKESDTVLYIV